MQFPSGQQYDIRFGNQRAVAVEVGAALRMYEAAGQQILDGFGEHEMADGGRGQPLLPWPNRILDGQYEFDGHRFQLPIEEVARHNAIHGLTRWQSWTPIARANDRVTLGFTIHPRPGYPFTLELRIEYALAANGLSVTTTARNVGTRALPFGAGQHPYLSVGTATVDDAKLQLRAGYRLELDPQRMVPTSARLPTAGTEYDFTTPKTIGALVLDDCFGDLHRDTSGRANVVMQGQHAVTLWMDRGYRYVQLFSGDTLEPSKRRRGLAIEPMTCPPNAFRSGQELIVLQPGEATTLAWGISLAGSTSS